MHPDTAIGYAPGCPGWLPGWPPAEPDFPSPPPLLSPDAPVPPWRLRALIEDVRARANSAPQPARRCDVHERDRASRRRAARDAALIALAGLCGLPVCDLTALLASSPGERHRQPLLLVPGRFPRELPLFGLAAEAVRLWVEHRHGERSEWLFFGVGKRDGVVLGQLSQQGLSDALKRRSVLDPGVSFRRSPAPATRTSARWGSRNARRRRAGEWGCHRGIGKWSEECSDHRTRRPGRYES